LKIFLSSSICVASLSGVAFAGTLSHRAQPQRTTGAVKSEDASIAFPISSSAVPNTPSQTNDTYTQALYLRDAVAFARNSVQPVTDVQAVDAVQTHTMRVKLTEIALHEKVVEKAKEKAMQAAKAKRLAASHTLQTVSYSSHATLSSRGSSFADVSGGSSSRAVAIAEQYVGTPYRWAGSSPSGFDCSGLVMYVYNQLGVPLSHSSYSDFNTGQSVSEGNLRPGDLVFFDTDGGGASHVGIYVGGGSFISASGNQVQNSSLDNSYWGGHYIGARRP
jgi:cell wall-associated NlpC family hydrolase